MDEGFSSDDAVRKEPDIPRALRLERVEDEIRELHTRISSLEYIVTNVLGIESHVLR